MSQSTTPMHQVPTYVHKVRNSHDTQIQCPHHDSDKRFPFICTHKGSPSTHTLRKNSVHFVSITLDSTRFSYAGTELPHLFTSVHLRSVEHFQCPLNIYSSVDTVIRASMCNEHSDYNVQIEHLSIQVSTFSYQSLPTLHILSKIQVLWPDWWAYTHSLAGITSMMINPTYSQKTGTGHTIKVIAALRIHKPSTCHGQHVTSVMM